MKSITEIIEEVRDKDLREKLFKIYSDKVNSMKYFPAAKRYHHFWKGGYFDHIQEVMNYAIMILDGGMKLEKFGGVSRDRLILMAFIHDFDKLERYGTDEEGKWMYKYKYPVDGYAKVVSMISDYDIKLTDMEIHALTFHHGGWSEFNGNMSEMATILNFADMCSAKLYGHKNHKTDKEAK